MKAQNIGFKPASDGGGEIHDAFLTIETIAFLYSVPRFILAAGFWGCRRTVAAKAKRI
jgi:hypothetical protein